LNLLRIQDGTFGLHVPIFLNIYIYSQGTASYFFYEASCTHPFFPSRKLFKSTKIICHDVCVSARSHLFLARVGTYLPTNQTVISFPLVPTKACITVSLVGGWVGSNPVFWMEPAQKSVWLYFDFRDRLNLFRVWLKDWGRSGSVQCLVEGIQRLVNINPAGAAPSARFCRTSPTRI